MPSPETAVQVTSTAVYNVYTAAAVVTVVVRAVLIEGRFVEISRVFFSQFLVFQIFFSFFPNIWHAKPSKHFALCEIYKLWKVSCFSWEKQKKIWKELLVKNGA